MAQVLHLTSEKLALRELDGHARVANSLQHVAEIRHMGVKSGAEDDNVVNVAQRTDSNKATEHELHSALEESWAGRQALRCAVKLKAAPLSGEGGLVAVLLRDGDLIIPRRQIQRGEVHSSVERV